MTTLMQANRQWSSRAPDRLASGQGAQKHHKRQRTTRRGTDGLHDSSLEGTGFELRVPLPEKRRSDTHHSIRTRAPWPAGVAPRAERSEARQLVAPLRGRPHWGFSRTPKHNYG